MRCKALDDFTYKDIWRKIGSSIDVDIKDVEKLEKIGAIQCLETIPEKKVKINVIKNPIKIEKEITWETDLQSKPKKVEEIKEVKLNPKVIEKIHKKNERIKRKYNRRDKNFMKRR